MSKSKKANNQEWQTKYIEKNSCYGTGGNATVILVEKKDDGNEYVLKPFTCLSDYEKKKRFEHEVEVVNRLKDKIEGIIPIVDYMIDSEKKEYWYVMPVAVEIKDEIKRRKDDYKFIIKGILELAETLAELHNQGHSHRDIKPENIYYYDNRCYIGDFGLVSFLDSEESLTKSRALGAYSTMAPEMRRYPHLSDGKKADVYSLAKTLWILLSGKDKGFDGVYSFRDNKVGLRFDSIVSKIHIVELEELLRSATDNDPDKRPTMEEFKNQLEEWFKMKPNNFHSKQVQNSEWRFINTFLFGEETLYTPETAVWEDIDKIFDVLSLIASLPAFNHMLYVMGGLDFCGVEKAAEDGYLYLYEDFECNVIKPRRLIYCNFLQDPRWNYFLLELDKITPILVDHVSSDFPWEFLVEATPGHYVSAKYSHYGVYDYESGEPLPDGWKLVRRCVGGKFLICPKFGPYNSIHATYDGRHTQCDSETFRMYINTIIEKCKKYENKSFNERRALNSCFNKNPFDEDDEIDEAQFENDYNEEIRRYVKENIDKICFSELLTDVINDKSNNSVFKILYNYDDSVIDIFDLEKEVDFFLCKDGYFKSSFSNDELYYCNTYSEAELLQKNIANQIIELYGNKPNHAQADLLFTSIEVEFPYNKPKHLFNKTEIEKLMRNADDRHHNLLVINTDGYAEIIQDKCIGHFYPVCHEMWNAGNNYVGKYSKLSTLDEVYIYSLQGWLMYLATRKHIRMDYDHGNHDEKDLISKIEKYY